MKKNNLRLIIILLLAINCEMEAQLNGEQIEVYNPLDKKEYYFNILTKLEYENKKKEVILEEIGRKKPSVTVYSFKENEKKQFLLKFNKKRSLIAAIITDDENAVDILYKDKLVFMRPKELKKKLSLFHFNKVETKQIISTHHTVKIPKFNDAEIDCFYLKGTNLFLVKDYSGDSLFIEE